MKSIAFVLLGLVSGLTLSNIDGIELWQELLIIALILIGIGVVDKFFFKPKD